MCGQIFVHIVGSGTDEQCVVMTRAIPPATNGMNTLTLHTTNAREVTRGMECSDSGSMNNNFFVEWRMAGDVACA